MAEKENKMFKNYPQPEGYIPDNHDYGCTAGPFYATIVRGTTPRHSFELPFDIELSQGIDEGDVRDLIITYKQGLEIILTKTLADVDYIDNLSDNHCIIYYTLTQEETNLFEVTDPNNLVQVQIKVLLNGEDEHGNYGVMVTPIMIMNVLPDLSKTIM